MRPVGHAGGLSDKDNKQLREYEKTLLCSGNLICYSRTYLDMKVGEL